MARVRIGLFTVCLALLAGCQSAGITEVLDVEQSVLPTGRPDPAVPAPAVVEQGPSATFSKTQTIGKGEAKVTMLLPLSAAGVEGVNGRKMRDGALMAMAEIGQEFLRLTIIDTGSKPETVKGEATKAMGSGARLLIGPADAAALGQMARVTGPKKPVVLGLAENYPGNPGVYAVKLTEADSASAGAASLAAKGLRKFVLLTADGPGAAAIEKRVENALSIHGATLVVTVSYGVGSGGILQRVAELKALVAEPEAIVVASGNDSPVAVLEALKAQGLLEKKVVLIGTHRWLERPINSPLAEGAYIASLDRAEVEPIAAVFKATYGYEPDLNAAYAYDAVALAAGIVSSQGVNGLNREIIQNTAGFRGSTGIFRFREDGGNERTMPLYQVRGGKLEVVEKITQGF